MLCKSCKTAMRIKNSYYTVSGGDSPEDETRLWSVAELCCPNKKCAEFGRIKKVTHQVGVISEGEENND